MKPLHVMLVFGLAVLPQVAAAERCRQIVVAPDEKLAGNTLRLSLVHDGRAFMSGEGEAAARLRAGASVDLCFESSTDGYVSLWSHDADNNAPVRILPNEYIDAEDDELGFAVEAGMERCFSELSAGRGISLTVQPPYGEAEVYLHFSEARDGQIAPGDYPSIGNKSFRLASQCDQAEPRSAPGSQDRPYASATLRYEVVE